MCSARSKLMEQHANATLAYEKAVSRMKQARGQEFERAWRLVEDRRNYLKWAWRALVDHEQEHFCDA